MARRKPFFVLAPMDDVTDTVFRQVVHGNAPADLYFTEFVNVDGLMSPGRQKLMKKLRFAATEGPLVAQLWGLKPENFEAIAKQIADGTIAREIEELNKHTGDARVLHGDGVQGGLPLEKQENMPAFPMGTRGGSEQRTEPYIKYGEGSSTADNAAIRSKAGSAASSAGRQAKPMRNFVGIDINMGCPAKSEVQNGACSALIKNRPLAAEIIEATKRGAGVSVKGRTFHTSTGEKNVKGPTLHMPVSVKTRLGFNEIDLSWHEFLLGFDLFMLTVHWRTRKEMSKVPAHWDYAAELVKLRDKIAPKTLLVGNGDVMSRAEGEELANKYGLDGIMIGRGIFHDPFVFAKRSVWGSVGEAERKAMLRRHVQLFAKTWAEGERNIKTLNKFSKIYISDFDGAKELREQCMAASSTDELLATL